MTTPILYEMLVPNQFMGQHTDVFDQNMSDKWQSIFNASSTGSPGEAERASILLVLAMRALLTVVAPRPPGNVHARQKMTTYALPHLNETICSKVTCLNKEIKRERRYVDFEVSAVGADGRQIYKAQMSLIWAA